MCVSRNVLSTNNRLLQIFFILLTVTTVQAQFFSAMQLQSGFSRFEHNRLYLLNRAGIRFGQKMNCAQTDFYWNVKYQPEIFDLNSAFFSQYINGRFSLRHRYNRLSLLLHFRSRYQNLKFRAARYAWQSSDMTFQLVYDSDFPSLFWTADACLWYRNTKDFDRQKLNAVIYQAGPSWKFKSVLFQFRLYHEHYELIPIIGDTLEKKHGNRSGFSLHIERAKNYLFSVDYRLLFHAHQHAGRLVTDYALNVLMAFWLSPSWTVLFYGEYRKLGSVKNEFEPALRYTPVNSTDRMYLKLGKDINKITEFYLKFGKEQEQLMQKKGTWEFWQFLIGFTLKKEFKQR